MRARRSLLALPLLSMPLACGGAPAEPKAANREPAAVEPAVTADSPEEAGERAAADDGEPKVAPEAPSGAEAPEDPPGDEAPRKIVYRMTPTGLVIDIEGVQFEPKVAPFRKKGGWGVRVTVVAKSTDGKMHRLLSPEGGPLAFAAWITKGGKQSQTGDQREGDEEQFLPPDDSLEFSREFPGPKDAPLYGGQSLELHVGLWGLGLEAERRRPVRKLFLVKMIAGNATPQPVITAPE